MEFKVLLKIFQLYIILLHTFTFVFLQVGSLMVPCPKLYIPTCLSLPKPHSQKVGVLSFTSVPSRAFLSFKPAGKLLLISKPIFMFYFSVSSKPFLREVYFHFIHQMLIFKVISLINIF